MNNKKWYIRYYYLTQTSSVYISILVLILTSLFVIYISRNYYDKGFAENVLVEAHGMLFDILVIGIFILFLNKRAERRIENQRYLDEIDDFRGWESKEAAYRIAGNIKRLKRNGFKGEINLDNCYMTPIVFTHSDFLKCICPVLAYMYPKEVIYPTGDMYTFNRAKIWAVSLEGVDLKRAKLRDARLYGVDLKGAKLQEANLQKADLRYAILQKTNLAYTDLTEANLWGAKNLTIEQLSKVKTLYNAILDPELMAQVKEKYPHLLEKPKPEEEKTDDVQEE